MCRWTSRPSVEAMTELDQKVTAPVETPDQPARVRWSAVAVFVVIAFGASWLIASPLWLHGGQKNPYFLPIGLAMMLTPTLAALVATRFVLKPDRITHYLALVPVRPWRRTVGYALLGFVGVQLLGLGAIGIAWAVGVTPVHLIPGGRSQLLTAQVFGLATAVAALGEEIGWRGFLLRTLRPLGTWPALIITGLVWGPWHAPLILLGYNYGTTNPIGVVLMTVTTTIIGILFGWLRIRSGSIYPSAFAHGALNGSTGVLMAVLLPASAGVTASVLGWTGWLLMAVIIAALAITGTFRWVTQGRSGSAMTRTTPPNS